MTWHVFGGRQPPTPEADREGLVGVWMAAVVGPIKGPPPVCFDLATAYGPTTAAGLGPLPYLTSFDYRPTAEEVDALCPS
jgi:hypothetical protein